MSEVPSKRRWWGFRWSLPLLLGFVVAAILQWGLQDERGIPGTVSLIRTQVGRIDQYADALREQAENLRARIDEGVQTYVDRARTYAQGVREAVEALGSGAQPPRSEPEPAVVASGAIDRPAAEPDGKPGMSYEDPLAPLAFLTKRMEAARSAAETERRRAAAERRRAVALARSVETETGKQPVTDHAASAPRTDRLAAAPAEANGGARGVAGVDLGGDGAAVAEMNGNGHANGTNGHAANGHSNGANGHTGNGAGAHAALVPYPDIVPRPPGRNGNGGSMSVQPTSASGGGSIQPASLTVDPAGPGSRVTIGEPTRDLPPSTRLLASAAGHAVPRPPGQRVAQASSSGRIPPPPSAGFADDDDEEPPLIGPERAPALESQRLHRVGGVLLPPGRLRIEPSLSYSVSDRFRIVTQGLDILDVIFIGAIDSSDTRRESLLGALTFRYGVSPRFNIRGTIPYEWRSVNVIPSALVDDPIGNSEGTRTERVSGLGDVSMGFSYQLYRSDSRLPNVVGNFNYSFDTGEPGQTGRGSDQVSGGLTFMTQSDPAVLFGSLNYLHAMDEYEGFRRGDMVGGSLGFSYALNYDLSLSTTLSFLRQIEDSEFDGQIPESLIARRTMISTLSVGVTYALTNRTLVDMSVGMGLTDDAPELVFSLSFPMAFNTSNWW